MSRLKRVSRSFRAEEVEAGTAILEALARGDEGEARRVLATEAGAAVKDRFQGMAKAVRAGEVPAVSCLPGARVADKLDAPPVDVGTVRPVEECGAAPEDEGYRDPRYVHVRWDSHGDRVCCIDPEDLEAAGG